jgi:glycosyltransferase involved in cell wall biosynthesis
MINSNAQKNNVYLKGLSIVVPVYNSEKTLVLLVERIAHALEAYHPISPAGKEGGPPSPLSGGRECCYELLLVNDGSRDGSWQEIERLGREYPWVRGINLMRNYGQHNALLCGIRNARYDVVVTIDDDLQHPPEEIHKLLDELEHGYDVVYGTPLSKQHGLWRNLASYLLRLALQTVMGVENARKVSAFRALRTQLREAFADYQSPHVTLDALLTWGTTRFSVVPTRHDPRHVGKSTYTFGKLILQGFNMITHFTVLPLQFASWMGFAFAFFGGLVLVYVVGRYLILGYSVPGFPFLASTIAVFSGVQLFTLGIIGEYLARMHFRLMERPTYVVREKTGSTASAKPATESIEPENDNNSG